MAATATAQVASGQPHQLGMPLKIHTSIDEHGQESDQVDFDLDTMNKTKVRDATFHAVLSFVVAVAFLSAARIRELPLSLLVGVSYLAIFVLYLANILYILCRAPRIYRVYSVYEIPTKWASMPIAAENREYHQHPITSISEFSAIAGGASNMLLARLGSYAFAIILTFVCSELSHNDFEFPTHLLMECIGSFGLVVIGTFYLDPYCPGMRIGHNTGVGLSCFTLIGLLWQRIEANEHIWLPVLLIVVFVVFFLLFWFYPAYPSRDPEQVTKTSLRAICLEAVALSMLTIAASLYFVLYSY